jgi:hypothetical protein
LLPGCSFVILAPLLFFISSVPAQQASRTPLHVPDEVVVRFRKGVHDSNKDLAHSRVLATLRKSFETMPDVEVVKLHPSVSVKKAIQLYLANPDVLYAEPNYIVRSLVVPNDPQFSQLWGLHNTGQSGGTVDADIDAPEAWNITTGSSGVVVAVIDTGIDYNHQDLAANMFRNTADCNSNGIDDDGNGFVDDCFGIDTANDDSNPMDDFNHGTHVAGTIGAVGNNNIGVVGVNWNVRLMACKFLDSTGSGAISDAIDCLNYLAMMKDRGVSIVATNNSWGGGGFSQALLDAIQAHLQRGILFIVAAGNESSDNDVVPTYPCNYYLPNIICVAATTRTDALASFSNRGRRTVHLGAPGQEILSTTPANTYSTFNGTSMATPHVTGVAALLKAQNPNLQWSTIKNLILAGGDSDPSLSSTVTGKRLNANGALTCSNSIVTSRLKPVANTIIATIGTQVDLAAVNINCGNPNGNVAVTINPGGQIVNLFDNGSGADQVSGDGIYSGQWIPQSQGTFTLTFPDGNVTVIVPSNYVSASTSFNYRTITGTNLNLGDDSSATVVAPFPIPFAGGSFANLFVSSNGNVNLTAPFFEFTNAQIPTSQIATLVAPFWDDLLPVSGTAQNVFWAVTGSAPNRELVVEWRDVRHFSCSSDSSATVKFQIVFFEANSNILFNYADTVFGGGCTSDDRGGSATVGVQVAATLGNQFSFNAQSLNNNTAILWTLPSPTINVTPLSQDFGNVNVGSSADKDFTVQNSGGGTLTGNASTNAPYSIVSGGSYNLGPGQSQPVTVRFSPTSAGTFMGNVTFTGGGGATGIVSGVGIVTRTLTVASSNPSSGVSITVTPNDNSNQGNGTTQFTRIYNNNTSVTLTAAATAGGNNFSSWSGCDSSSGTICNVTMSADKTASAAYVTPRSLTLASSNPSSGAAITVSPADNNSAGSGTTQFTRIYNDNTAVTLTAAATAGGNNFSNWSGCDNPSGNTCNVTMSADKTVTAVYVPPGAITLTYNQPLQDRVGQANQSRGDTRLDPTFTVTFPNTGSTRTVTSLRLDGTTAGGTWDTNGGTGFWTLGAARDLGSALLNLADDSVNFSVAPGGSFVIFASEWFLGGPFPNGLFQPGNQFTLTMGFSDNTTATASTTIPGTVSPTVTIAATTPTAVEGGASGAFTVTRTGVTASALTVNYAVGGTAVAGINYTGLSGSVVIPVNSSTAVITVTPMENNLVEGDKTVVVTLSANAAYTVGSPSAATVTVQDNDAVINLAFSGLLADRVGQNNLSQGTDQHLDPTFTVTFPNTGGTRTVTSLRLDGTTAGGTWDTNGANGFWTLGAARDLASALLNLADDSVNFSVAPGGSFLIFTSDWFLGQPFPNGLFQPGNQFTLTIGFSDNSTAALTVTIPAGTTTHILTVASSNPTSGAAITVSPNDNSNQGNGTTQFIRTYNNNTPVILTAAATAGGNNFSSWSGCDTSSGTTCNVTMSADKTVTAVYVVPSSPQISLTYDGQLRDKVGQGEFALNPDGQLDGTFTVTLNEGSGSRTVSRLQLNRGGPIGVWDTQGGDGFWSLGVASGLDTLPLLNAANDSVNFQIGEGSSFKIFAADYQGQMFVPGSSFTLNVNLADGSTAIGNASVP